MPKPPFSVAARYAMAPERVPAVVELMREVREESLKEPGCLSHEPHASADTPGVLFILEQYRDAADFEFHCSTEHFKDTVVGKIVPLLAHRVVTKGAPLF